jgi:hypothetical protein
LLNVFSQGLPRREVWCSRWTLSHCLFPGQKQKLSGAKQVYELPDIRKRKEEVSRRFQHPFCEVLRSSICSSGSYCLFLCDFTLLIFVGTRQTFNMSWEISSKWHDSVNQQNLHSGHFSFFAILGFGLMNCACGAGTLSLEPCHWPSIFSYFWDRVSLGGLDHNPPITDTSHIAWMTEACHYAQPLLGDRGSHWLLAWALLEPRFSHLLPPK